MMKMNRTINSLSVAALACAVTFFTACGSNESILKSGKETPSSNIQSPKSSIEQELDAMRTADFRFIYVIRRKDGGVIDEADRAVLRTNTSEVNRRVAAEPARCPGDTNANTSEDCNKAFLLGSNNAIPPNNMMALYQRFAIEDYSPQQPVNTNVNAK